MNGERKGRVVLPLILVIFAFYIIFWLSVMIMKDISLIIFLLGLITVVSLSFLFIRGGESLTKVILTIVLGIILCAVAYFAFIVIAAGPTTQRSHFHYRITFQGLDQYRGGLITTILVPLPYWQDKPAFSDEELMNMSFDSWRTQIVMTDDGKMLAFQTLEENPTNIDADFLKYYEPSFPWGESFEGALLPQGKEPGGMYTSWLYGFGKGEGPSTILFIDESMEPGASGNTTLSTNIEFYSGGGTFLGIGSDTYRISIREEIPGGIRGPIPVITQLGKLSQGDSGLEWTPLSLS
jgi:hypothetical protein